MGKIPRFCLTGGRFWREVARDMTLTTTEADARNFYEFSHRVTTSINILHGARRQTLAVYDERIRRLRQLSSQLATPASLVSGTTSQLEMFDVRSYPPDLVRLVDAPLAGLL
jgi:sigma54-dependent transcription regulator